MKLSRLHLAIIFSGILFFVTSCNPAEVVTPTEVAPADADLPDEPAPESTSTSQAVEEEPEEPTTTSVEKDDEVEETVPPETKPPKNTSPAPANLDPDLHPDIVEVIDVKGRNPGNSWQDSYSVGDECFCATTFDHMIGEQIVDTPDGPKSVRDVCEKIGDGPGIEGRPVYNDIQCGNGPINNAGDENDCPGRVDIGQEGCGQIGPKWDLSGFE